MNSQLIVALIGAFGGSAVGSLLASWLTPKRQHQFWVTQRRADLCLDAFNRLRVLLDDFIPLLGSNGSPELTIRVLSITKDLRLLFSADAYATFAPLERMLAEPGTTTSGDFINARDLVLRAFYSEIGLEPRSKPKGG